MENKAETPRSKKANQLLSLSRAIEASPAAVVITDREGRIEYVNPKFTQITGYSPDEAIGQNPRILQSGLHPIEFYRELWSVITSGREWIGEFCNKKKNGERYWEKASISPVFNGVGEIIQFVAVKEDITERKLIDAIRQESESRLRTILNAIQAGVVILDAETHVITDINPAALKMIGERGENVLGKTCHKYICPAEKARCPVTDLNQSIDNSEATLLTCSGTEIPVMKTVSSIELRGREHLLESFIDISSRKRMEKELIEARNQLEDRVRERTLALAETNRRLKAELTINKATSELSEALISVDSNITSISNITLHHAKLLTESAGGNVSLIDERTGELVGQTWAAVTEGTASRKSKRSLETALSAKPDGTYPGLRGNSLNSIGPFLSNSPGTEIRSGSLEGNPLVRNYLSVPVMIGDKLVGTIELADSERDYTKLDIEVVAGLARLYSIAIDRRETANALLESEQLYRTLSEKSLAGVMVIQDWKVVYSNPSAAQIAGYSLQEVVGKTLYEFVYPEDMQDLVAVTREMLRGLRTAPFEFRFMTKKGEVRWLMETLSSIVFNGKQAILVNGIDVTEERKAEEERLRLEDQVRQAQKMEAIGTLAGGIAHDFNNILGAISGYAELGLEKAPEGSRVRRYLSQIFEASRRAVDLVSQILEFSRQSESEPRRLRMRPLTKEVLRLLRATIPRTIEIRRKIDAESDMVLADPAQIHQLVLNLCTNAYHAMQEKGGVLTVELVNEQLSRNFRISHQLKPGNYLKLTIQDTGAGIAPEHLDKIFDPFFTTKKPGEGTGLGLSVVHGIVKKHRGTITVESRPGEGSTFKVYLPTLPEIEARAATENDGPVPKGSEHVLFVDDEFMLAQMMKDLLEGLGYRVTAKTNSVDALETFRSNPDEFDLVITDYTMPEMTGIGLAREIIGIRPQMPVILCTGFSQFITPEVAKSAGIREFILKPIIKRDIAATIRSVLNPDEKA